MPVTVTLNPMRVACCGLTTLDVVQYVDHWPGPDEKVQAQSARVEFGGPAANAAFTAVALGTQATLISAVGAGPVGQVIREQITQAGIDLLDRSGAGWDAPVSAVAVAGATRSVISVNAARAPVLELPDSALDGCQALLVDGHHVDLCVAAASQARTLGIPVLLDGGSWKPGLNRLVPLVDAAILSADFSHPVDWGARPVAISRGPQPILFDGREFPVPVVDVVDTVGAGDVLHGAVLVGIAGGSRFEEALRHAAEIASESCRYPGAHAWSVTTRM